MEQITLVCFVFHSFLEMHQENWRLISHTSKALSYVILPILKLYCISSSMVINMKFSLRKELQSRVQIRTKATSSALAYKIKKAYIPTMWHAVLFPILQSHSTLVSDQLGCCCVASTFSIVHESGLNFQDVTPKVVTISWRTFTERQWLK